MRVEATCSPGALMMLGSAVIRWSDGTRIEAASSTGASEDVGESMNSSCGTLICIYIVAQQGLC